MGQWDGGAVQLTLSAPIRVGNALWFYYYGTPAFHVDGYLGGDGCLGVAKLRLDGFASLRANWREGIITTKPFLWHGGKLIVNYTILGGIGPMGSREDAWIRAEVLDEQGHALPGYSREQSDPLFNDVIAGVPTWSMKPQNFDHLIGNRIRLRFYLREAEIYSFRSSFTSK